MDRFANRDHLMTLDPVKDAYEIYRCMAYEEFPWDISQSLGLALFRTYAVPSIGDLLYATGQFTENTQKRYDDTVLLMDAVLENGTQHERGRAAARRINQMHRSYDISNDDLLYVLCTFVVVPIRWIDTWGWRTATTHEREASAQVYTDLGRLMNIADMPDDYAGYARFMDAYEEAHFGYSTGGNLVARATLRLMTTFAPFNLLPAPLIERMSYSLMDEALLTALRLPRPRRLERDVVRKTFRGRALIERRMSPRSRPKPAREMTSIRTYRPGTRATLEVDKLGTFPGCPVQHTDSDRPAR